MHHKDIEQPYKRVEHIGDYIITYKDADYPWYNWPWPTGENDE